MKSFKEFYLFERNDLDKNKVISRLVDKIFNYLKKWKPEHLKQLMILNDSKTAYYLQVKLIDKLYGDLLLAFREKQKDRSGTFSNYENYKIIQLFVLDDINNFDISDYLITKDNKMFSALTHELVYYYDNEIYDVEKQAEKLVGKGVKDYYNIPHELEAYLFTAVKNILSKIKKSKVQKRIYLNDFNEFKDDILFEIEMDNKDFFNNLTNENRKRILKRIYSIWNELKEMYEEN